MGTPAPGEMRCQIPPPPLTQPIPDQNWCGGGPVHVGEVWKPAPPGGGRWQGAVSEAPSSQGRQWGGRRPCLSDSLSEQLSLPLQFVEPCKSDKWSVNDVRLFLTQYTACAHTLDAFRHQSLWERYMSTIKACLLKMYHD
uniref:Uncharacterized protein n=1 Tax=Sphenodon punctatus TaxID=8508 RepID=A0A8D0GTM7_SPHPU